MNPYGLLFDYNLSGGVESRHAGGTQEVIDESTRGSLPHKDDSLNFPPSEPVPVGIRSESSASPAQTISGEQLRDQGIQQVSEHNENWMEKALIYSTVRVFAHRHAGLDFTGEEIRFETEAVVGNPKHPNAWGALINTLIKRKIIIPTGEHRHMKDSRSHARSTPVYKAP